MINFYKGYIDCAPTNASGNISHVAGKFSFKIHVAESHIFEELGWGEGGVNYRNTWMRCCTRWVGKALQNSEIKERCCGKHNEVIYEKRGGYGVWGAKFMKIKFGGGPAITLTMISITISLVL